MKRLIAVLALTLTLTGCGTLGFGGADSKLGDGQIDVLKLLAIAGGIQSGDATPLCEVIVSGQTKDATQAGLLLAACRGLLGQAAGQSSLFGASAAVPSAAPSGPVCEELRVAFDVAANACNW
jgi:hypothetical protein